ncbi:hypothetical protein BCM02_10817 [Paenibacillus methanolicus]|uniref:Uncharacterized protein n=1 Tax=Paenibacillus methanolicus TaxID=582686 RepID=A0A5S5C313_9BACL|nr:hypothetical protein BCM02_10817 [Paenibacillus methanolicus]
MQSVLDELRKERLAVSDIRMAHANPINAWKREQTYPASPRNVMSRSGNQFATALK